MMRASGQRLTREPEISMYHVSMYHVNIFDDPFLSSAARDPHDGVAVDVAVRLFTNRYGRAPSPNARIKVYYADGGLAYACTMLEYEIAVE
jgi:hypothetical protein